MRSFSASAKQQDPDFNSGLEQVVATSWHGWSMLQERHMSQSIKENHRSLTHLLSMLTALLTRMWVQTLPSLASREPVPM